MSSQTAVGRSLELVGARAVSTLAAPALSPKPSFELIDAAELARRLMLPVSWIRSHTRARTADEIPCVRFGKYVRFRWGSPELERWLADHQEGR